MLNGVVAVYYCLRVIMAMYFKDASSESTLPDFPPIYSIVIANCIWALFSMGVVPREFLLIARKSAGIFI